MRTFSPATHSRDKNFILWMPYPQPGSLAEFVQRIFSKPLGTNILFKGTPISLPLARYHWLSWTQANATALYCRNTSDTASERNQATDCYWGGSQFKVRVYHHSVLWKYHRSKKQSGASLLQWYQRSSSLQKNLTRLTLSRLDHRNTAFSFFPN